MKVIAIDPRFLQDIIEPAYLVGEKFGRLTVKAYVRMGNKRNPRSAVWSCDCDCGDTGFLASSSELRQGIKKSCDHCQSPDKKSLRFGVVVLNEDGYSVREISRKTGVPRSTVQRWLDEERDKAA